MPHKCISWPRLKDVKLKHTIRSIHSASVFPLPPGEANLQGSPSVMRRQGHQCCGRKERECCVDSLEAFLPPFPRLPKTTTSQEVEGPPFLRLAFTADFSDRYNKQACYTFTYTRAIMATLFFSFGGLFQGKPLSLSYNTGEHLTRIRLS